MVLMVSTTVRVVAHTIHYVVTIGGLVGVAAFLVPQHAYRRGRLRRPPLSEHERRVAQLRADLGAGPILAAGPALGTPSRATTTITAVRTDADRVPAVPVSETLLPLAVVLTAAAAAVHAFVCPDHFRENILLGLFFLGATAVQLGGTLLVLRIGCRPWLLVAGSIGNGACVALWAWTRSVGIPFGLGDGRESVGAWDIAAVAFEVGAMAVCAVALARGSGGARVARWTTWGRAPRVALGAAVVVLAALSLSGVSA